MGLKGSITVSGRLKLDEHAEIIQAIDELELEKGWSRSTIVVEALKVLFEMDTGLIPYADSDKGELARIRSQQANQNAIMAQFDILNERLDLIFDRLDQLRAVGIEITPDELAQGTDIPDALIENMRQRYHSRNR